MFFGFMYRLYGFMYRLYMYVYLRLLLLFLIRNNFLTLKIICAMPWNLLKFDCFAFSSLPKNWLPTYNFFQAKCSSLLKLYCSSPGQIYLICLHTLLFTGVLMLISLKLFSGSEFWITISANVWDQSPSRTFCNGLVCLFLCHDEKNPLTTFW